jgi:hypothetical protein
MPEPMALAPPARHSVIRLQRGAPGKRGGGTLGGCTPAAQIHRNSYTSSNVANPQLFIGKSPKKIQSWPQRSRAKIPENPRKNARKWPKMAVLSQKRR